MKLKKNYFFIIFTLFFTVNLIGQEKKKISKIIISGNEKTKTFVIMGMIRTNVGDPFIPGTLNKIKRYLENQRKFSKVLVSSQEIEKNKVIVYIYVKDKWSLILAPYFNYSHSEAAYGFLFLESNFLGLQNILLFSLIKEYGEINGKFAYSHPRVLSSLFSYVIMGERNYFPIEEYNRDQKTSSFYRDEIGGLIKAKYQFYAEHYLMLSFKNYEYKDDLVPKRKGTNRYWRFFLELDWLSYTHFFAKGTYLGFYYEKDFLKSDVSRSRIGIKFEQYFNPFGLHNIYINAYFFHTFDINQDYDIRIGSEPNFYYGVLRGYESRQLKSNTAFSGTFEYRLPLFEVFSTTFMAVPFYDSALVSEKEDVSQLEYQHSIGLGVRFYLKEVLIPAIQIYFAYGLIYNNISTGFMIGARM